MPKSKKEIKFIKIDKDKLRKKYPTIYKAVLIIKKREDLYLDPKLYAKFVKYEIDHCESFLKKLDNKKISDIVRQSDIEYFERKFRRKLSGYEKNSSALKVFCGEDIELTIMLKRRYIYGDEAFNVVTQLWDLYEEGGNT